MKIVIRNDASKKYRASIVCGNAVNWVWLDKLKAIEGKTIEVETDFLFRNQFNTVPITGVSESGLRIMEESVEKVIDDDRKGKVSCGYCGKTVIHIDDKCSECGEVGFLEKLY